MANHQFCKKLAAVLSATITFAFLVTGAHCLETGVGEADYHNNRGMEYFKKGFYEHAPRHQDAEAERNYGLAVTEFKAAIAENPASSDAHRNLARLYYVRKNFAGAAAEYKKVSELSPGDVDAYVNHALACIELSRLDEAVRSLEQAKDQTFDPKALEILDSYIAKVRDLQTKEVR